MQTVKSDCNILYCSCCDLIWLLISVRAASVDVIEALIAAGADPNSKNQQKGSITPLTLVLLRGASSTVTGGEIVGSGDESIFGVNSVLAETGLEASVDVEGFGRGDDRDSDSHYERGGHSLINDNNSIRTAGTTGNGHNHGNEDATDRARLGSRRVWIRAAEMLVKSGTDEWSYLV